ncbi:serine hydrolase domain-containing protein [Paenibacillus sp. GM2]|uniref:serine hydrolase domain-containing protein n=1 Tax=Paenibacillus sp. GM2 TaxID=1622070 RepID=UPI0008384CDE|nr:serine hydrolase [Paenibacillus sp. GM2]
MNLASLPATLTELKLRSCLISKRGQLIFEYYKDTNIRGQIAKINSCTKSILSALICIAMDQGAVPPPETAISKYFPELVVKAKFDGIRIDEQSSGGKISNAHKLEITIEHLLTMSAGFDWTEFGGQNSFPKMTRTPDWIDFVLNHPLSDLPGARMEYNSGVSQLLSAILVQATGLSVAEFAEKHLFSPLRIESYKWETDPQGFHTGGFGLWLRPADMLKFGQLYLQQGIWEHQQIISPELIARSVKPALPAEAPRRGFYGWHWWADSLSSLDYFYARGFGGQFIHVIPSLEIVVVQTHDNRKKKEQPDIFREYILPLLIE